MAFRHTWVNDYEVPSRVGQRLWKAFQENLNDYNDYERPSYAKSAEKRRVAWVGGRKNKKNPEPCWFRVFFYGGGGTGSGRLQRFGHGKTSFRAVSRWVNVTHSYTQSSFKGSQRRFWIRGMVFIWVIRKTRQNGLKCEIRKTAQ